MAYLNKIMLIGNLGKDAEIKVSQSGKKNAKFSLATTERFKDKQTGESKDQTEWHNIVAWGQLADIIERLNLKKGVSVYVEGKQTSRYWDDPAGQKKTISEVIIEKLQVLTPQKHEGQQQSEQQNESQKSQEDDLPF